MLRTKRKKGDAIRALMESQENRDESEQGTQYKKGSGSKRDVSKKKSDKGNSQVRMVPRREKGKKEGWRRDEKKARLASLACGFADLWLALNLRIRFVGGVKVCVCV